ncbi:hypothetical protein BRC67_09685 [Halobacteriales archaeon QH_3_68_24]|nr:MAG: hypothetical protein BRC67_09685 [Halobacteriales archaeon QH_3_68_24]
MPAETAESVEVEADLLGFDSPASYVRWVVSRRFAIDDGSEPSAKLEEYAARVRELDESGDRESLMEAARHAEDAGETASEATGATTDAGDDADGATPTPGPEPGGSAVDRIEDDEIDDAVNALSSVEQGRVDEFARRALSRTRERLDGDVETGIDYSARNALDDGAPPGSEITDLSALGVPGRDEKLMKRRRRAVGAALAYLKDAETAKRGDFVAELYEEHPAGYESVDGAPAGFRSRCRSGGSGPPPGASRGSATNERVEKRTDECVERGRRMGETIMIIPDEGAYDGLGGPDQDEHVN